MRPARKRYRRGSSSHPAARRDAAVARQRRTPPRSLDRRRHAAAAGDARRDAGLTGKARSRPQPAATIPRSGAYQDAMPDINDRDDETQLVRRARRGQEAAFAEIYRRHARAIHSLALRLTGNHATAEDITQECFLKMLQFLGAL